LSLFSRFLFPPPPPPFDLGRMSRTSQFPLASSPVFLDLIACVLASERFTYKIALPPCCSSFFFFPSTIEPPKSEPNYGLASAQRNPLMWMPAFLASFFPGLPLPFPLFLVFSGRTCLLFFFSVGVRRLRTDRCLVFARPPLCAISYTVFFLSIPLLRG